MKFKVGDIVKLKDYEKYHDWKDHRGKTAKIININGGNMRYPFMLRWDDETISTSPKDNLILARIDNWKEEMKNG